MIQKISSAYRPFSHISSLCCDLDLEHSNLIFPQDTPAYDAVLTNQVWLQRDQQFRRHNENSQILIISPHCDLDTENSEPIFPQDTLPHDNTPPYQIW